MKLTYFQLEPHLTKKLAPVYIVSGEDPLLKHDALHYIRKAAKTAGFNSHVRLIAETGFDWQQLYLLLNSSALFAQKQRIELDLRDVLPNKAGSDILEAYSKHLSENNLLLINIGKIDAKIAKSAWYLALEKIGMVVNIWPIPRKQLPQWIQDRARKYKLTLSADVVNLLADHVEGNLAAAAAALEKIYLFKSEHPVDANLIKQIVSDESSFTIFDFVEHLFSANKARALHMLEQLKQEDTEPVLILWAITRELRVLADMIQQLQQGSTHEMLWQKHRIFAPRQPALRQFLANCTSQDCWKLLTHAAEIDRVIKGAVAGDVWQQLQMFCLRV
jgi:DNA polymerase-3 subunit delta